MPTSLLAALKITPRCVWLGVACSALSFGCSSGARSDAGGAGGVPSQPSANGGASPAAGAETGGAPSVLGAAGTTERAGAGATPPVSGGNGNDAGGPEASSSAGSAGGPQWSRSFPTFTKHVIATFASGYATVIADVDHDGKPDVVALSAGAAGLVWFKNPSWEKHTITTGAKQLIYMAPYDIDGDQDLDFAIISDFDMNDTNGGGTVSWAEAPSDPTQNQEWELHAIDAIPTSHRLRFADIDGDGKKELIDLPLFGEGSTGQAHAGAVKLTAYSIPADPKGKWSSKVVDDQHLEVSHGLTVVDWDGDKVDDLLTAANDGVDLFRPAVSSDALHLGAGKDGTAPARGSSEVVLGNLGGARFLATIEPWHGTDTVIYTPGASAAELWTRDVLGSDFQHGHGMAIADFNGDGFDEVVGGGGEGTLSQIIYRFVPSSGKWDKILLDMGAVAVSGIDVSDMNGDGAVDIVTIGGNASDNLVWYENSR